MWFGCLGQFAVLEKGNSGTVPNGGMRKENRKNENENSEGITLQVAKCHSNSLYIQQMS